MTKRSYTILIFIFTLFHSYATEKWSFETEGDLEQLEELLQLPDSVLFSMENNGLDVIDNALSTAEHKQFNSIKMDLLFRKAIVYEQLNDRINWHNTLMQNMYWSEELGNREALAKVNEQLGNFYLEIKDYQKAHTYYLASQNLYEEIADTSMEYTMNFNLGLVHRSLWQSEKALPYFKKALQNTNEVNGIRVIEAEIAIGESYFFINNPDSAYYWLYSAYGKIDKKNKEKTFVQLSLSLGNCLVHLKKFAMASKVIDDGIEIAEDKFPDKYVNLLLAKSQILRSQSKYYDAIELAGITLEHAKKNELRETEACAINVLAEAYNALGDRVNTAEYLKLYSVARSEAEWHRNHQQMADMQVRYDTERKLAEKQSEITFLDERLRHNQILKYVLVALLILILFVAYLFINRWKLRNTALRVQNEKTVLSKEKLQAEVDAMNAELRNKATFIAEKNNLLAELQQKLRAVESNNGIENSQLQSISSTIDENLYTDNDWLSMKMHFEKVYPEFFKDLTERYPKLTPLDLRHCAYLKMKLSNKELAQILSIEANSVKTLRYRLKKKLMLEPEEDLFTFMEKV